MSTPESEFRPVFRITFGDPLRGPHHSPANYEVPGRFDYLGVHPDQIVGHRGSSRTSLCAIEADVGVVRYRIWHRYNGALREHLYRQYTVVAELSSPGAI